MKAPHIRLSLFPDMVLYLLGIYIYVLAAYLGFCNNTGLDILNKNCRLGFTRRHRKGFSLLVDCVSLSPATGEGNGLLGQRRGGRRFLRAIYPPLAQPGEFISLSQPQKCQNKTLKYHSR